jgi:hypothetical protein
VVEKAQGNDIMSSTTFALPSDMLGQNPKELLEVTGLPSETERATKQLSASANGIIRAVVSVIDDIVLRTMEERTAEGFAATSHNLFPQYFAAMTAMGALIRVTVPPRDVEWMIAQSLSALEADFRDCGAAAFGTDLRDRGIFTVWTLRKITDLAQAFKEGNEPKSDISEEVSKFAVHAIWARFHIDCLVKSMRMNKPIFPDTVEQIVDGLRAGANAYGWIRRAVDSYQGTVEPNLAPIPWEEEDEILLSDSMRDLLRG